MNNKKVYVGNLSFDTTQSKLEETFAEHGELEEVRLITDMQSGRSRGFAFITYKTEESAQACVDKSPIDLDGRTLKINIALDKPKSNNQDSPGRRY